MNEGSRGAKTTVPGPVLDGLKGGQKFVITTHLQPDGDAVGSALGLSLGLESAGKEVTLVAADPLPPRYAFLKRFRPWFKPDDVSGFYDAAIFVDCTDPERAGGGKGISELARMVINIDHHVSNSGFGDVKYVDAKVSAVGEQVFYLLKELGVQVDPVVATCLYTAISTDTGSFRYENTGVETHRVVAELLELGADTRLVVEKVYEEKSLSALMLLGQSLCTLRTTAGGQIAWMWVTRSMLEKCGAREDESDGIINYASSVEGVEIGILFREAAGGRIKVGLRSRKKVDVSELAMVLGGGGHPRAAGCWLEGEKREVEKKVLDLAEKLVDQGKDGDLKWMGY